MSAAAASPPTDPAANPAGSRRRRLLAVAAGVLALGGAGAGGYLFWVQRQAAAFDAEGRGEADEPEGAARPAESAATVAPPHYLPLDPFVVNLADRDTDRYAQVGITLEVTDAAFAERMRAFMPSIRNAILLILSHKTAAEMLDRDGKDRLAAEIAREAVRPMGIDIEPEPAGDAASARPRRGGRRPANPVRRVHFSSFIVQ